MMLPTAQHIQQHMKGLVNNILKRHVAEAAVT